MWAPGSMVIAMSSNMDQAPTKAEQALADKMVAFAADGERVAVLGKARAFKRSWLELAEALTSVQKRASWQRWGYDSMETYCRQELHLKGPTVAKLLGSYQFLRNQAPKVIERARRDDPEVHVPSVAAVDFVARAVERGAAPPEAIEEIQRAAFDEGAEPAQLSRRFKEVAFPISREDRTDRLRSQLVSTARRLANLIAEPDAPLPGQVALAVEEAVGQLLEALEN